ncbi:MAG: tetratricopeptide repeat protein [Candidatus Levyibacteriota bacterium]
MFRHRFHLLAAFPLAACIGGQAPFAAAAEAPAAPPTATATVPATPQGAAGAPDGATAQAPAGDPRGMSDAQRKAYTQSLREARDLLERKEYDQAIARLDKLSAEQPREAQARFIKGVALADAGRTDEAIAQYRALVADFPELPEPRNNLAVLYASKGEYQLARDELERAVQSAPDYAIAHENLGDVYARLAQVEYERTVALDKRNRSAPAKLKLIREAEAAGR